MTSRLQNESPKSVSTNLADTTVKQFGNDAASSRYVLSVMAENVLSLALHTNW